ncbi:hypothetical protein [Imhoffiella purpurea]|uniref:Uncharacterized protein n=1 Tax=Imhoffiella purpurea TaxID=1249627 RepID=W9VS30_9GAMM|nr:hypothetical protein [Imhoffiella purpurea]EXJ13220.1 hypothetical protein D779_3967 [Imhoffiella purpurea]
MGPTLEIGDLPQKTLPGATRSEVKSLAMGAARSKGWTIAESDDSRLILQRPTDGQTLPTGAPLPPGATLEVTSYFVEQQGGVTVATKAELVSPVSGAAQSTRNDYTDDFRGVLDQSLDSLADSWRQHRARLARAAPPASGWKSAWDEGKSKQETDNASPSEAATPDGAAASAVAATEAGSPPPTTYEASPSPETAAATRPTPEPRRSAAGAAPVVDATAALSSDRGTPPPDYSYSAPSNDMMRLPSSNRGSRRLTMAANAEDYAREHGCEVEGSGSQLIESRRDGEVHKVPCAGSDSFLVKCQDGICKSLL